MVVDPMSTTPATTLEAMVGTAEAMVGAEETAGVEEMAVAATEPQARQPVCRLFQCPWSVPST